MLEINDFIGFPVDISNSSLDHSTFQGRASLNMSPCVFGIVLFYFPLTRKITKMKISV